MRMPLVLRLLLLMLALAGAVNAQDEFTITEVLNTTTTLGGQPITFPAEGEVEVHGDVVEIAPGGETGRHKHPYPAFMYVLAGTLVLELDDGTSKTYTAGQALIEDAETWFNNKNPGQTPTRFVSVLYGNTGQEMVVFPE